MLKEYIVIRDHIPIGLAINSTAHASLMLHLKYVDDPIYQKWIKESFKKVVCVCNNKEFAKLKNLPDVMIITESSLDGDNEVGCVLAPREDFPNVVKFLRMFK